MNYLNEDVELVESLAGEHILADIELLDFGLFGRAAKQVVQLSALLPLGPRRLSASTAGGTVCRRGFHPARFRHSGRLPYSHAGASRLQVRPAQTATPAQRHHLEITQHDVLQSSN